MTKKPFKKHIPRVLRPAAMKIHRQLRNGHCFVVGLGEKLLPAREEDKYLPPARLRNRVHGSPVRRDFFSVGKKSAEDIVSAVGRVGHDLKSLRKILDFGCGCGRTLVRMRELVNPRARLFGTDIDKQAIIWCQKNLDFAKFEGNDALPKLNYPDNFFDFVYAVSVFTHLDEEYQFRWLEELARVLEPGGVLVATVHGDLCRGELEKHEVQALEEKGFYFRISDYNKGNFPDWYQTTFHSERYVRDNFSRFFRILAYLPGGLNNHHDIVILKK